MVEAKPVRFRNMDGHTLFGIYHPANGETKRAVDIIILSPGIKSRVAPHRLYLKMARNFAEAGYNVLRFDYHGLGDSEGEVDEKKVADFYGSIQVGRYVNDTIAAMDWMENETGSKKFMLAGLCGGAITGLLAGAGDPRVDSLMGLGIPVILDSSTIDRSKYITEGELVSMQKRYIRKLFSIRGWLRFLTLRSDYRTALRSFLLLLARETAAGAREVFFLATTRSRMRNGAISTRIFQLLFMNFCREEKPA